MMRQADTAELPLPSEFCRDAAPLMRKACRVRLRSPKLQLLGTLLGLSSMLLSALGDLHLLWPWGEPLPLDPEFLGLEKTLSLRLTFWLQGTRWGRGVLCRKTLFLCCQTCQVLQINGSVKAKAHGVVTRRSVFWVPQGLLLWQPWTGQRCCPKIMWMFNPCNLISVITERFFFFVELVWI